MQPTVTLTPVPLSAPDAQSWPFSVEPVTPVIGAEIGGIDLSQVDETTVQAIRRALLKYKVLFFRDQNITAEQHVALARRFGELEIHPTIPHHPEHPELVVFGRDGTTRGRENVWHSDVSWREIPSMGSILRCIECPKVGGDTLWVNMVAAYENLPEAVKARIANLQAVHDGLPGFTLTPERRKTFHNDFPPQTHPVVRTHPETGEKILFVNEGWTTHLANFLQLEPYRVGSDARFGELDLLAYLYRQASQPEYQVRLKWRPNTIAFWDNRATQHYAVSDYFPAVRHMNRATIIGDRPR
ncbi:MULTISPECIES: TauD/TfdA dioxygenase family protein [unclassified Paraburkholderia]|uniref:TauD/TfdA dioxygenase family protein n=1 Tax=unclassified Paraburkholderia TaxID=2615204 RepID=UPI002AB5FD34|nr:MULTISPECIES: TauD/TfdA family dioxygenase [unclassified Paraburkholderia]